MANGKERRGGDGGEGEQMKVVSMCRLLRSFRTDPPSDVAMCF